jgi:hypothetical protein
MLKRARLTSDMKDCFILVFTSHLDNRQLVHQTVIISRKEYREEMASNQAISNSVSHNPSIATVETYLIKSEFSV